MIHEPSATFTLLDFIMIGVVGLSAFFGFMRGVTREVLTIGSWVLAIFTTLYGIDYFKPLVYSFMGNSFISDIVAIIGLFFICLVISSMFINLISNKVKASSLGSLDRTLGLVFGGMRGIVVLMAFFALAVYIWPKPENRPDVMQKARLIPFLTKCTGLMVYVLPRDFFSHTYSQALTAVKYISTDDIVRHLAKPHAGLLKRGGSQLYSADDRQKIEDLYNET